MTDDSSKPDFILGHQNLIFLNVRNNGTGPEQRKHLESACRFGFCGGQNYCLQGYILYLNGVCILHLSVAMLCHLLSSVCKIAGQFAGNALAMK